MSDVVELAENPYSRLIAWEVWNFMSIAHAKAEFDERNILNFKGYNDSGKSAMLQALKVLVANTNPTKQVSFIQDDKDYFRVIGYFSDGITILRDKYINGQSLYEMYKDNTCIYSSKQGNTLTRITDVPKPIADYLGLIMYDGVCLNARACFEKQIGVQTTGAENYSMFNAVLKSEEIASAGKMLNNDKNKLLADINTYENELSTYKTLISETKDITEGMITYLKNSDSAVDSCDEALVKLGDINNIITALSQIALYPVLDAIETDQLSTLANIDAYYSALSEIIVYPNVDVISEDDIEKLSLLAKLQHSVEQLFELPNIPEVAEIDISVLEQLSNIKTLKETLDNCVVMPEVPNIEDAIVKSLENINMILWGIADCTATIQDIDSKLEKGSQELDELNKELLAHGVKLVKCPDCGAMFDPDGVHGH
ncbi:MAG: hypothetical protein J6A59_01150 [Lachnospiraceae bacterium]|nr:hypothetical protein [Lachnospiraceae bacterium]